MPRYESALDLSDDYIRDRFLRGPRSEWRIRAIETTERGKVQIRCVTDAGQDRAYDVILTSSGGGVMFERLFYQSEVSG
jgi:hypothetical protein